MNLEIHLPQQDLLRLMQQALPDTQWVLRFHAVISSLDSQTPGILETREPAVADAVGKSHDEFHRGGILYDEAEDASL